MKMKQKNQKYDFCFYKQDLQFVAIWQHWDNEKQNCYFFLLYKIFLKRRNTTSMINKVSLINEIIFLKEKNTITMINKVSLMNEIETLFPLFSNIRSETQQ